VQSAPPYSDGRARRRDPPEYCARPRDSSNPILLGPKLRRGVRRSTGISSYQWLGGEEGRATAQAASRTPARNSRVPQGSPLELRVPTASLVPSERPPPPAQTRAQPWTNNTGGGPYSALTHRTMGNWAMTATREEMEEGKSRASSTFIVWVRGGGKCGLPARGKGDDPRMARGRLRQLRDDQWGRLDSHLCDTPESQCGWRKGPTCRRRVCTGCASEGIRLRLGAFPVGQKGIAGPGKLPFPFSFMFYFLFFLHNCFESNLNLNQPMSSTLELGVTLKL
jgi:hypothetical protein